MSRILVTGGSGFIGSNLCRYILNNTEDEVVNLSKHTYSSHPLTTKDLEKNPRYKFIAVDITDSVALYEILLKNDIDSIFHLAAETMVTRSFIYPRDFLQANTVGTFNMLEILRRLEKQIPIVLVSTDEVLGSVPEGKSKEDAPLNPQNPYACGKAGGELWARTYHKCYKLPIKILRIMNVYGPFQHPEKLIPRIITSCLRDEGFELYPGSSGNRRYWVYVEDAVSAIHTVLTKGKIGETYHIGSFEERSVAEVAMSIMGQMNKMNLFQGFKRETARLQDDERYCLDFSKIQNELGWKPRYKFEEGIEKTIAWFRDNPEWWQGIRTG